MKRAIIEEIKRGAKEARRLKKSYFSSKLIEHQEIIYEILEKKRKNHKGEKIQPKTE